MCLFRVQHSAPSSAKPSSLTSIRSVTLIHPLQSPTQRINIRRTSPSSLKTHHFSRANSLITFESMGYPLPALQCQVVDTAHVADMQRLRNEWLDFQLRDVRQGERELDERGRRDKEGATQLFRPAAPVQASAPGGVTAGAQVQPQIQPKLPFYEELRGLVRSGGRRTSHRERRRSSLSDVSGRSIRSVERNVRELCGRVGGLERQGEKRVWIREAVDRCGGGGGLGRFGGIGNGRVN
ncbi:MAG: hypothetical protein M1827_007043 [Pycnora praestabilis]|nr:MAG: hypothetical protein M1827_007043 [Pycnora praestabilis]